MQQQDHRSATMWQQEHRSATIRRQDTDTSYERSRDAQNAPYPHHSQNSHRIFCRQSSIGRIQTLSMSDVGALRMSPTDTTAKILIESSVLNHTPAGYRHSL